MAPAATAMTTAALRTRMKLSPDDQSWGTMRVGGTREIHVAAPDSLVTLVSDRYLADTNGD
jgi:hypothetical protein